MKSCPKYMQFSIQLKTQGDSLGRVLEFFLHNSSSLIPCSTNSNHHYLPKFWSFSSVKQYCHTLNHAPGNISDRKLGVYRTFSCLIIFQGTPSSTSYSDMFGSKIQAISFLFSYILFFAYVFNSFVCLNSFVYLNKNTLYCLTSPIYKILDG